MTRSVSAEILRLQAAPASELVARYRDLFGSEPRITRHSWMFRRIAWQLQADAHGGLSDRARTRLDALMAELPAPPPREGTVRTTTRTTTRAPGLRKKGALLPGTVLEQTYKGATLRVTILEDGVEYEGRTFSSLSSLAREITGSASINGKLFFGLTKRSRTR